MQSDAEGATSIFDTSLMTSLYRIGIPAVRQGNRSPIAERPRERLLVYSIFNNSSRLIVAP